MTAVLSLAVSAPSYAFTETKVPPPMAQPAPEAEAPALQLEKPQDGPGLSLTTPDDGSGGTELKIPGVGSIGKLPKLDFGLELLYGGDSEQGTNSAGSGQNDDVLIKGKIRHRF
ncbi:MAG: hypothetical protein ACFCUR_16735 [Rhodomicrobiaceae bacterium]